MSGNPVGVRRHLPLIEGPPARDLAAGIRDAALGLGFARIGFVPAERLTHGARRLSDWLNAGYHGDMAYMAGPVDRAEPRQLLEQARTLIVVAAPYATGHEVEPPDSIARQIARYARGSDYHHELKAKLHELADACARLAGRPILARSCVDSAPLLEREAAAGAGVGFAAKSTLAIIPGLGSYFFLGELLVDLQVEPSAPTARGCGSCTRCLSACPTGAFVDAYTLDARRCISYLTIEFGGAIPRELRPLIGQRVFGCDVCQEVCPYNASTKTRPVLPAFATRSELRSGTVADLLEIGAAGYRRLVKNSALSRVSRQRLARNAAIALGNSGDRRYVAALMRAATTHSSALVRGHAAWALGRLGGPEARAALLSAASDPDSNVRDEAALALAELEAGETAGGSETAEVLSSRNTPPD